MMSPQERIKKLTELLQERFPGISPQVDAPTQPSGDWFVDLSIGAQAFVIELRPDLGFGLSSTPSDALGEGPDEFYEDEEAVVSRLAYLLKTKVRTEPQRVHLLQELREKCGVSQVELANKLGVKQPTISKMERREDINLSTLQRFIQALGGQLSITAQFATGAIEIVGHAPEKTKSAYRQTQGVAQIQNSGDLFSRIAK